MGQCAPSGFFQFEDRLTEKQKDKHQQTYLEFVKERKEVERLMNPKKWWEYWR